MPPSLYSPATDDERTVSAPADGFRSFRHHDQPALVSIALAAHDVVAQLVVGERNLRDQDRVGPAASPP